MPSVTANVMRTKQQNRHQLPEQTRTTSESKLISSWGCPNRVLHRDQCREKLSDNTDYSLGSH